MAEQHIGAERQVGNDAVAAAVVGDMGHARIAQNARRPRPIGATAADVDRPAIRQAQPCEALHQFRLAVAVDSGQRQDFASADIEAQTLHRL